MVPLVHHTVKYLWTWHVSFFFFVIHARCFLVHHNPWKIPVPPSPGRGGVGTKALRHRSHWAGIFFTKVEITASPLYSKFKTEDGSVGTSRYKRCRKPM